LSCCFLLFCFREDPQQSKDRTSRIRKLTTLNLSSLQVMFFAFSCFLLMFSSWCSERSGVLQSWCVLAKPNKFQSLFFFFFAENYFQCQKSVGVDEVRIRTILLFMDFQKFCFNRRKSLNALDKVVADATFGQLE
jgi:hypothetical protein